MTPPAKEEKWKKHKNNGAFGCHYIRMNLKGMVQLMILSVFSVLTGTTLMLRVSSVKETVHLYPTPVSFKHDKPLLDIFTTFIDRPRKVDIYKNTLMNWVHLDPGIGVKVFTNSSLIFLLGLQQHISVLPLPRTNEYGFPFLKDMYKEAGKVSTAEFIGYTNADILFDEGLRETLSAIKEHFKDIKNTSILVVANRKNADIFYAQNDLYEKKEVTRFAKNYGQKGYHHWTSSDCFFIKNIKSFPWHKIKDVVIATPGFDGHVTHMANLAGVHVVDVTKTILALHQTGLDGNAASMKEDREDLNFNRKLIKYKLPCGTSVPAAKFFTDRDIKGTVKIFRRNIQKLIEICKKQPKRKTKRRQRKTKKTK